MTQDLTGIKKKLDLIDSKTDLLLRSLADTQLKLAALQAITIELASRSNFTANDAERMLAGFAAKYPPELVSSVRKEVRRLMPG